MLQALSQAFYRRARWRLTVVLLVLCIAGAWVFNASSLPFANPALMHAGCGEGLLDVRPGYSADEAYRAMVCYGEAGRTIYRHFLAVDSVYLLLYGSTFTLLLSLLLARHTRVGSVWALLNLLPLCVAAADAVENSLLFTLLQNYPQRWDWIGNAAGVATASKWGLSLLGVVVLLACLARNVVGRVTRRTANGV